MVKQKSIAQRFKGLLSKQNDEGNTDIANKEINASWSKSNTLPKKVGLAKPDHWKKIKHDLEKDTDPIDLDCGCYRCERRRLEKEKQ